MEEDSTRDQPLVAFSLYHLKLIRLELNSTIMTFRKEVSGYGGHHKYSENDDGKALRSWFSTLCGWFLINLLISFF